MRSLDHSPDYYRKREAQEREMAETAISEESKAIHLALAENYRLVAEEIERRQPK